jgi:hypothetical protein
MPWFKQAEDLKKIFSIIENHPQGIGISFLEEALVQEHETRLSRRTLQRRLEQLISDARIISEGKSTARVYRPVTMPEEPSLDKGPYVPMSSEGARIQKEIQKPLMHRRPVGYEREFLLSYMPGKTWYLPEGVRAQLHDIGRTPAGAGPAGTYARDILGRLLVDLSWASSKLEGNTYSRLDTQQLIEFGRAAEGKDVQETQMILNHKAAIEMLVADADQVDFDLFTFQNLHAVLSQNLMHDEDACGRLRRRPVDISGTVFYPLAMPQQLEDFFRLLLDKAKAIPDPFEQAFFLLVQLPYLQPFEDVNKRVARIGANIPLIKQNLCPLSFVDVPERSYVEGLLGVYELNKIELLQDVFVWAFERSCQRYLAITKTLAQPDPLKIRYRQEIIQAVQEVVNGRVSLSRQVITDLSKRLVPEQDRIAFAKILDQAFLKLHEGSVARYRLRRSDFLDWVRIRDGGNG